MKVALYYPWIYLKSGVARTILETVKRSKHKYTIYTNHFDIDATYPEFKRFKVVELNKVTVNRDIFSVFKAAITISSQKINLEGYDLLMVHSDGLGDLITIRNPFIAQQIDRNIPIVCYCHTPLRPVFDEYYRSYTLKDRPCTQYIVFNIFSYLFKLIDQILWNKYSYVVFNSKESLRRAKVGGLLSKIKNEYEVLSPGVDVVTVKPTWIFKPYFFLPGRIMWTKNIELAIRAFKIFQSVPEYRKFKLVIGGQVDKKSKLYLKKLKILAKNNVNISYLINPTDKKMQSLYQNSWTIISTAFNEDFGMTLLEANSYGKPVIALNRGGYKETQINGKSGLLVEMTAEALAVGMAKLARNKILNKKMGVYARQNVEKYDWKNFIVKFDDILSTIKKPDSLSTKKG